MNICHYDWFNKQADWPIAKEDKVKGKVKLKMLGGSREESEKLPGRWGGSKTCFRGNAMSLGAAHRLIKMG